jgi:hypothetical protein
MPEIRLGNSVWSAMLSYLIQSMNLISADCGGVIGKAQREVRAPSHIY